MVNQEKTTDFVGEGGKNGAAAPSAAAPFSEHVHLCTVGDKQVYLVGTAHISKESAAEVSRVIATVRPDTVCVELCDARHKSLVDPQSWREMDIVQLLRRREATTLLAHLILASFQRKMGSELGIRPGAEMLRAIEVAGQVGAKLVLADRNIRITLLRTWRSLRWWERFKLSGQLLLALLFPPQLNTQEVEDLKRSDVLSQVIDGFAKAFPRAKAILIDERDLCLAENIRNAPGKTVVAVVGAGHVQGTLSCLAAEGVADLSPLLVIPPRSVWLHSLQWLIPLLVVGLFGYGFFALGSQTSWKMVQIWVLANGVLAAVGAALALAHPLTIATAFVAAPLTSLNPLIAAGWVAGFCQAWVKKPKVKDFESLAEDIATISGFWKNGITRILLVVALANLGSSLGTFIGIPLMSFLSG